MVNLQYPPAASNRGIGFWLKPANLWASRQKLFRVDYSNDWRYEFGEPNPPDRSVPLSSLLSSNGATNPFRFVILGDTGEGGHAEYGLLPLLRALSPGFMIINGDTAYPSGRIGTTPDNDDFLAGFFEPYRNMNCPIWATIGNHEYYSPNNGLEFYKTFCTYEYQDRWEKYRLNHSVLQPGTYWELDDLNGPSKLVILGLDTGKCANLDGHNDWWQFWKGKIGPDLKQDAWLRDRLDRAEKANGKVIVLFHIPALVREAKAQQYLNMLHRAIAGYSCVKLVISAHEHNFQFYRPDAFRNFLQAEELAGAAIPPSFKPPYIVAGSSGASLEDTLFTGTYTAAKVYPSRDQWEAQATWMEKAASKVLGNKNAISDAISRLSDQGIGFGYGSVPMYSTFLLVEVAFPPAAAPPATTAQGGGSPAAIPPDGAISPASVTTVTPVFLDDPQDLFADLPEGSLVDVMTANPSPSLVKASLKGDWKICF